MSIKRLTESQGYNGDNKRLKSEDKKYQLPIGFFDDEKNGNDDGLDDDWAKFQNEINESSTNVDTTNTTSTSIKPSVISTLMNRNNNESAIVEAEPVYNSVSDETKSQNDVQSNHKDIPEDDGVEEDEQEKLLQEFEKQEELHERVERMKKLREQKKNENEKLFTTSIDKSQPPTEVESPEETDESDNDDDLWRRRHV